MNANVLVDIVMTAAQAGAATFLIYGAWLCLRHAFTSAADMDLSEAATRSLQS